MSDLLALAEAKRTARAALIATWMADGKLCVYDGTRPATPDTAITTQVQLLEFAITNPAATVALGVLTTVPLEPVLALADGTATWARMFDDTDAAIADLDVGLTDSGTALTLDRVLLAAGGIVSITSLVITEG